MTIWTRTALALALALAAGLAASASAQAFHVERDFDLVRGPTGAPLQNRYMVSLPLRPVLPDAGNASATTLSKCVGDANGPAAGDGVLDALDLACAWWTARATPSRAGAFTVATWNSETCAPVAYTLTLGFGGRMVTSGYRFPFDRSTGYTVLVSVPTGATYSPANHVVLEGDPDPAWAGVDVSYSPSCGPLATRATWLNFPYDSLLTHAVEIACGQEGVDWNDADGDGRPDTCWDDADGDGRFDAGEQQTGLYDGRHSLMVQRWVNTPAINGFQSLMIMPSLGGRFAITGIDFPLVPGEAYAAQVSPGYVTTRWDPPTR